MAIGINDLDDDLDDIQVEPSQQLEPTVNQQPEVTNNLVLDDDFVSDFLRTRGIDDISSINFEDENGLIISRDWKDLSKEEKINILNTPLEIEDNTPYLSDDEINLLSQIRQSNLSPEEYIKQFNNGNLEVTPTYKIDDLSDDEVYLLDLESRVGELSDEDAALALNIAKQQNEELYKKQIEGIRKEYKNREDLQAQQEQAQIEQQLQQAFELYQAQVVDAINGFTSIGNLDLNFEDADKEELAEFMLSQDESGKNYLYEALQDPETLTKAAWFILNGEEALNSITDYFTKLIKMVSENQYKKGLEDGKKGIQAKPTVVINNTNSKPHRQIKSIEDLDDDE